jgi:hypothetical protein
MSLFTKRDVDAGEQREPRQVIAFFLHGPLRLDENVEDIETGFPDLAATQTEGDVMGVVLQVEGPDAGRAQVPAFFQVMNDEGLFNGLLLLLVVSALSA